MNKILFHYIVCALLAVNVISAKEHQSAGSDTSAVSTEKRTIIVVPVEGNVEPAMAAFIGRAVREGETHNDALYVLKMDTFGGRVDAAFQIVDTLLRAPKGKTIAFVKNKAISAGALIALACSELAMREATTIGDCAPITYSNEGPKMMGEKFQSPLRAKFRSLAKRNGYPQTLAESMVTKEMTVYKIVMDDSVMFLDSIEYADLPESRRDRITDKKTVVGPGELLTMDDREAVELGFSQMSVQSIEEMLKRKGIEHYTIVRIEQNWSERMVRFITTIAPLLMLIGFAGLYIEIRTPGFGIPGIAGILCLALVFLSQYMVGLADYTELLIIIIGLVLLGVEVFVTPGFGLVGFGGILCIVAGMILSFQGFVLPEPSFPWQYDLIVMNLIRVVGSFVFSFVLSLAFIRYLFPKIGSIVNGPYLSATLGGSRIDPENGPAVAVGDSGITISALRPAGRMKCRNKYIDVVSEGDFIAKDCEVDVVEISGNRVVVREKNAH
jgi:membrane-bound serine protease (ClpP class)